MEGGDDGNKESPEVNEGEEGEKKNPSSRIKERIDEDSLVYWESLLDQRSLHVLLVENDASVRLVITLLLRKCGYQRKTGEVDTPGLSGIALLCNIMRHNIPKHIPVMMSSRDSISPVFKCLPERAVDYLLKSVRKNELKSLWLHICRRWHSSCGSEREALMMIILEAIMRIIVLGFGLIVEGGSDHFSDTQGSS